VETKRTVSPARVLVVDRDAKYREWLRLHLGILCPDAAIGAIDLAEFEPWSALVTGRECDVLLLSAEFGDSPEDPDAHGLDLLRKLRVRNIASAVIALAEDGNELTAVRALQLGAADYLPKRLLTPDRLRRSVRVALRRIEQRVARRLADLAHTGQAIALDAPLPQEPRGAANAPADAQADVQGDGAGAPRAPEAETPPVIPGYSITKKIGESEKAVVYLATSTALDSDVALKVSRTSREATAERQALEREYKAILAIRHPVVVRIHDYGVENGLEYLAMEYFPRGDLKARMYFGVTEAETLRYLEQIAVALSVVHGAGLLHRDLKPPNVMLRDNDEIALIDFGLARTLDGGAHSTRTGVLRGSPYYMSPEQALGEELDARSDLYSLGVIYHEMLTGKKPFTGGSAMEVLQQHVNAPPPRLPLSLSRHAPILSRLLAKRREDRFNTADEVIEAAAGLRQGAIPQPQPTAA
jgi:eukaryotic-like serine/threonine-protein kinase